MFISAMTKDYSQDVETDKPCDPDLDNESEEKQSAEVAEMDDQVFNEFHAYSLDEFNFYVNYCIEMFNETVKEKK